MRIRRWDSFSVTNASENKAKLTYIRLNSQTPCPPRGAVPVNQGRCRRLFHSQHPDRLRSWLRPSQLCRPRLCQKCSGRSTAFSSIDAKFSFSEQDLVIPVNGIPLTVVRTYNSFDAIPHSAFRTPHSTDFGPGWTYALNDMDVVIDEDREVVEAIDSSNDDPLDNSDDSFNLRSGGGRNVTLTLPDGRRTTFLFNLVTAADSEDLPGCLDARWTAAPGVHATLSTPNPTTSDGPGDNTLICLWGLPPVWRAGYASIPMEAYDFPTLILTLQDGTKFRIDRDPPGQPPPPTYVYQDEAGDFGNPGRTYYLQPHPGKPRLTRIEQRTGDTIEINTDGLSHFPPGSTNATRTVRFDRDTKNRITTLRDPIAGTNGLPVVKYVYNEDTGNLIRVLRLVDRTAGTYLTNAYHYDHPKFPHYITAIDDAIGNPTIRNEYGQYGNQQRGV